jgi:uncharacterized membrane protein
MRSRPLPVAIAAVLIALVSLANLPLPLLPGADEIPAVVVYGAVVLGILGLVAAVGLWTTKTWSLPLTIVVAVLNILSAAPGVTEAPNSALQVAAVVGVVASSLVVVLVLLSASRRALRR